MLPPTDTSFLAERGIAHSIHVDGGMTCVIFPGWRVPVGYRQSETDLLLRLAPGYPDLPPDMWWCEPALVLLDGTAPEATQVTESYLGRNWQRWSRHFMQPGQWKPGVDGLQSYLARVRAEMTRSARRTA